MEDKVYSLVPSIVEQQPEVNNGLSDPLPYLEQLDDPASLSSIPPQPPIVKRKQKNTTLVSPLLL